MLAQQFQRRRSLKKVNADDADDTDDADDADDTDDDAGRQLMAIAHVALWARLANKRPMGHNAHLRNHRPMGFTFT